MIVLDPGNVFIEAVDCVIFVPQLGAVPTIKVVVGKGHLRKTGVVAGIILDSAAQLIAPVLSERLDRDVMLRMSEPVRAHGERIHDSGREQMRII